MSEGLERQTYRSAIGMQLLKLYNSKNCDISEDWMLFVATDHLNSDPSSKGSLFLFHLNHRAADKAASVAAFETASRFLRFSLESLCQEGDPWKTKYELSLSTYKKLADVMFAHGDHEGGKLVAQTLLDNAKTTEEKIPTLIALSYSLGQQQEHKESLDLSLTTLRKLNEYPKGKAGMIVGIGVDLMAIKRYFKTHTDKDILQLPPMESDKQLRVMQMLHSVLYQATYSGFYLIIFKSVLKMLRTTFKHGLSTESVTGITLYATIVDSMGDVDMRKRLIKLSKKVLKKTKAKELVGPLKFYEALYFDSWNAPLQKILPTFERGYTASMAAGRYEDAFLSQLAGGSHKYISGFPLPGLMLEFESLLRKMELYSVPVLHDVTMEALDLMRMLTGRKEIDLEELNAFLLTPYDSTQLNHRLTRHLTGMQVGVYFGNLQFSEKMIALQNRLPEVDKTYFVSSQLLFFTSICFSSMYRKSHKRSHLRKARGCLKELFTRIEPRGTNGLHRCKIMNANIEATKKGKSKSEIQAMFDEAIGYASEQGFIQDAGLAAQLAAEFFLGQGFQDKADLSLVRSNFEVALGFYQSWGAAALVDHIQVQIRSLEPSVQSP